MRAVIGISGGPNLLGEVPWIPNLHPLFFHDAAAALIVDGRIAHAVEEERVNRLKHTNCFPAGAIRACLAATGLQASQVEGYAFFFAEAFADQDLERVSHELRIPKPPPVRSLVARNLEIATGQPCPPDRIHFVRHHDAHCVAALAASLFTESLVLVIDGNGEYESTSVYAASERSVDLLCTYPIDASLGRFFRRCTRLLGFSDFDEYKVMGLAPYGNAARFRPALRSLYSSLATNAFAVNCEQLPSVYRALGIPDRAQGDPLTQAHRDFAAAAQELLVEACLDIAHTWQRQTGLRRLCMAGGVAQNCAMNGVIARSGAFDEIYVHPASSDAGTAIGAALHIAEVPARRPGGKRYTPLLGQAIDDAAALAALEPWARILAWEGCDDIHVAAAERLAAGNVLAWARGRAEFGPRALGSRSIVADPRPVGNRERINRAIKQREDFRPFAPAVLADQADRYFERPRTRCNLGEMCFVLAVREEHRALLGATTHVDGSARVQVVTEEDNPDFWRLIAEFNRLTGLGVILNTSFNNAFEPIVDSALDAVRTFLTTELDLLVLGPYLIRKLAPPGTILSEACVERPAQTSLSQSGVDPAMLRRGPISVPISQSMADWLERAGDLWLVRDALHGRAPAEESAFLTELYRLWQSRLLEIRPR